MDSRLSAIVVIVAAVAVAARAQTCLRPAAECPAPGTLHCGGEWDFEAGFYFVRHHLAGRCAGPPGGGKSHLAAIFAERAGRITACDTRAVGLAVVALGGGRIVTDTGGGQLVANDVMAYVEKLGSVNLSVEGRIKKLGQ